MNTILGANGVIAQELSRALVSFSPAIRQVSRNPRKVNPTDETVGADLLDAQATANAVSGSKVVYLVAGLKYDTSIWQEQWPQVMRNVIDACIHHGARLVFFDNVYAYGRVDGLMTEDTPFNPISKKGYDLTERFFQAVRDHRRGYTSEGPERAGKDVLLGSVFPDYPKPDSPADFVSK
ncbi:NAD(P)H-binding protein [Chloracidobacterium validum]|uniref:NAD(P)H-binding protein n=1 Tax=Chloracidobacterium validum TaxID=2821543 RepID=A0ABX8BB09_9BACT|nr:NAD(P)H-binding protein [Chloracidobacterium validum]QUW04122.1 NAD(P)H-binding protein [Chloracidobacterium validum]